MTISEVRQALGSWTLRLREDTPREVLDALTPFGHLAVLPGRVNPAEYGDNLLAAARYVGVYRGRSNADEYTIRGVGMAFWLGDEEDKGQVYEAPVPIAGETFPDAVRALLPATGPITEGTLYAGVPGTYTGVFSWTTPRKALTFLTDTMGSPANPVEWRVNGDGTLDAGPVSSLYRTTPQAVIVRKGVGRDLYLTALPGKATLASDVEDYTTRVVLLAQGTGEATVTGSADAALVPYKDLRGNPVRLTRLVSESGTGAGLASARAQLQLNRFTNPRRAVTLSTDAYDIKGDVVPGDYVWVYDPDNGFVDPAAEVAWRGERINPARLRVTEVTWPVRDGWTVAFRDGEGVWLDLSEYYAPESGETRLVVGDFARALTSAGSEPVGTRPVPDATIPAAPVFGTFATAAYQPAAQHGDTRAQIMVAWSEPLNVDGSTIVDGDHYEIRWRPNVTVPYPATWAQAGMRTWDELHTWAQPIIPPITDTDWHHLAVEWDSNTFLVQELTPGVDYEFQIRAVDAATPPNLSLWSATKTQRAAEDTTPPTTPAPPTVAGSRIAIQVEHLLGIASGGTFNLDLDLDHLEVHVAGSPVFFPDDTTLVGKIPASAGMITGRVPVVATFPVEEITTRYIKVVAVDRAGNKSAASEGVTATALLIDDAHISSLTVSKVTAGTITADWIVGARIKTGNTGARVELNSDGLQAFNASNAQTVDIDSTTGNVTVVGQIKTDFTAKGITILPGANPQIQMRWTAGAGHFTGMDTAPDPSGDTQGTFAIRRSSDGAIDGGKVLLWKDAAVLSYESIAGPEAFIWLGYSAYDGIRVQGRWMAIAGAQDALMPLATSTPAGFGSQGFSYGATMATGMHPVVTCQGTAGHFRWQVDSNSATGFGIGWDDTTAKHLHCWPWRG